jgi:hypothetical protein
MKGSACIYFFIFVQAENLRSDRGAPRAGPWHHLVLPIRFAYGWIYWYDIPTVTAFIHG